MEDLGLFEYFMPVYINSVPFSPNINSVLKESDEILNKEFLEDVIYFVKTIIEDENDQVYSVNKRNLYEIGLYYRSKYPKNKEVYDLVNELVIMLNRLDPVSNEDETNFLVEQFMYRYEDFLEMPDKNFIQFLFKYNVKDLVYSSISYDPGVIIYLTTDDLNTQESLLKNFIGKLEPLVTINWLMKEFYEKFDKENLLRVNTLLKNNEKLFLVESLDINPYISDNMQTFNKKLIKIIKDKS